MKKKVNVRNLSLMALFAALTAVGAFITIAAVSWMGSVWHLKI